MRLEFFLFHLKQNVVRVSMANYLKIINDLQNELLQANEAQTNSLKHAGIVVLFRNFNLYF